MGVGALLIPVGVSSMHASVRPAAALGALTALALLGTAPSAYAGGGPAVGTASATVASLDLDVDLLNGTVDIPVDVSLNSVQAPGSKDETLLTAGIPGVKGDNGGTGGPLTLVRARVAQSVASADANGSKATVDLANASVGLPGLLGTSLLGLDAVHAEADCPANGRPSADVQFVGDVQILGETVSVTASGPSVVKVPGLGQVSLWLSKRTTTSTTAAAVALDLQVSVNPLNLNVAAVTGEVQLAAADCTTPDPHRSGSGSGSGSGGNGGGSGSGSPSGGPSSSSSSAPSISASSPSSPSGSGSTPSASSSGADAVPASDSSDAAEPASSTTSLAETGGGSDATTIGGAGLVLLGGGAAAVFVVRRRRRSS